MIVHGSFTRGVLAQRGFHPGFGTYSYLPIACRVGRVMFVCSYSGDGGSDVGVTVRLMQNGVAFGDVMSFGLGASPIFEPDPDMTVLPAVDGTNLDGAAKVSLFPVGFAPQTDKIHLRYALELIPVDPTFGEAEIWQVYGTGEDAASTTLLTVGYGNTNPPGLGDDCYANGYVNGAYPDPVFCTKASGSEDGIAGVDRFGGGKVGVGTPLARESIFSNFQLISVPGGFDGVYDFSLRRNANSVLTLTTVPSDRIASVGGEVSYSQDAIWDYLGVASSGSAVAGHLMCLVSPNPVGGEAGLGAFGLGQRGLGG